MPLVFICSFAVGWGLVKNLKYPKALSRQIDYLIKLSYAIIRFIIV